MTSEFSLGKDEVYRPESGGGEVEDIWPERKSGVGESYMASQHEIKWKATAGLWVHDCYDLHDSSQRMILAAVWKIGYVETYSLCF